MLLIVLRKLLNKEKGCAECRIGDDYEDLDKDDREHESIRFWIQEYERGGAVIDKDIKRIKN